MFDIFRSNLFLLQKLGFTFVLKKKKCLGNRKYQTFNHTFLCGYKYFILDSELSDEYRQEDDCARKIHL